MVDIKWVDDDGVDPNTDKVFKAQHGKCIEVHVPQGVPSAQIKEPFRPSAYDSSSRPSLKALYDCKGNGVDELGFKTGDILFIIKDLTDGWYEAELNGETGFVPETYVERIGGKMPAKKQPASKPGGGGGKSKWQELKTDTGDVYYYNDETKESVWDKPSDFDTPAPVSSPTPAPVRPTPTVGGGRGTPSTSSSSSGGGGGGTTSPPSVGGRGVGGVPKFGGGVPAGRGAPVSSSTSKPEPKKLALGNTASIASAVGRGGPGGGLGGGRGFQLPGAGGAGRGGPPVSAPPKKSDWQKVKDESSGNFYYYNEKTNESTWDCPPGFTG